MLLSSVSSCAWLFFSAANLSSRVRAVLSSEAASCPISSPKFSEMRLPRSPCAMRFGVSQNLALRIDNRGPGACGLPLLRHNFLEVVLPVGVNPVREHYSFLTKIALYFLAKRSFPRAANGKIKGCGGRGNNEHEGSQQLEENPIPHFGASKRYPAPRTVLR